MHPAGHVRADGSAPFDKSRKFWEDLADGWDLGGTRIRPNERLCAISLVKRFAWPAFLSPHLDLVPRVGYYPDTATVAAAEWLRQGPDAIDPMQERARPEGDWSGQWLHRPRREALQKRNDEDRDHEPLPREELWGRIVAKRSRQGPAPAYLAILVLDGDRMGSGCGATGPPDADPGELNRSISLALARFSGGAARDIVEDRHSGTLIYSGGDDVLAFLPTRRRWRAPAN